MRRLTAVLAALALVALVAAPAMAAPGIRFTTHLTEDGVTVAGAGTVASPFIITTGGAADGASHGIQTTGTKSSPPLLKVNDSFYLKSSTANLTAYFGAKGWPQEYLDQINAEIAGTAPFFILNVGGGNGWFLADGFQASSALSCDNWSSPYCIQPGMYGLQIDDDYPVGTYTYTGVLLGQNHTSITFTFVMKVVRA